MFLHISDTQSYNEMLIGHCMASNYPKQTHVLWFSIVFPVYNFVIAGAICWHIDLKLCF